jgi:hypothetical protein
MGFHDVRGVYHEFFGSINPSLNDFRETDANADVGAITANGGILASDTTPILRGASGLISQEISWAASNSDPIVYQRALPPEFDGRSDVTVELWVNSGTTDAATFTVASSWDAGATVSDTATDGAKSATTHRITATIAAADVPDSPMSLSILLTPAAHTTNAIQLTNMRILYTKRISS